MYAIKVGACSCVNESLSIEVETYYANTGCLRDLELLIHIDLEALEPWHDPGSNEPLEGGSDGFRRSRPDGRKVDYDSPAIVDLRVHISEAGKRMSPGEYARLADTPQMNRVISP